VNSDRLTARSRCYEFFKNRIERIIPDVTAKSNETPLLDGVEMEPERKLKAG